MALFTSASAVLTSLGSRLIHNIRLRLLWRRDISIICGLNEQTLEFGQELIRNGARSVLFVEQNPDPTLSASVEHSGCVLRSDPESLEATARFLRSIGIGAGKRKFHLYALSSDSAYNQQYTAQILRAMEKRHVNPDNTTLTICCPDEDIAGRFLNTQTQYGFGNVLAINEPELAARMLVKAYPPCNVMSFDNVGVAQKDFHAVLIGFGHIGQAVLKQLVSHGQFCGSKFRLAVFAPNYSDQMGMLAHECDALFTQYDISFHAHDGRSCQMFDYLAQHADAVNYIAICTGDHCVNLEIAEQLRIFLKRRNNQSPIYLCSSAGVYHQSANNHLQGHKIYTVQNLCSDQIDRMAMVLHHHYMGCGNMQQNWKDCDYFSRMSSRSAADFWYTILRAAGTTQEAAKESWAPRGQLLENLSKMEHLRWNAFHFTMGFHPMPEDVYESRVDAFRKAQEEDPHTTYRIARDMEHRFHACLIPWEELDTYSQKENAVTGHNRDYRENDRDNIRMIQKVLHEMDVSR